MDYTILEFIASGERSSCGYCKNESGQRTPDASVKENAEGGEASGDAPETPTESEDTSFTSALTIFSISHDDLMRFEQAGWSTALVTGGAWAHSLSVDDYGRLLDMGWRRSGRYLYKPHNPVTCCPQFTIRLDVTKFKMSRSQKRAMRQMNEYLKTGKRPACGIKEEDAETEKSESTSAPPKRVDNSEPPHKRSKDEDRPVLTKKEIRNKRFEQKCRDRDLDPDVVRAERRAKDAARQRTIKSYIDEARPEWKHKLELEVVAMESDEFAERDNESFALYKKYQTTIHKDETCRLAGYRKFLCDSPLKVEKRNGIDLGSYHLRFLLDGKLIAVSVMDILPDCLSAKYMFYDPDYSFLSIGTYTALREIEYTQQLEHVSSRLKYYYMGYYIHSCPKMRYKAKFRPSDLLCDNSFKWLEFDACKVLLDNSPNPNGFAIFRPDEPRPDSTPLGEIRVFSKGVILSFDTALTQYPEVAEDQGFIQKVRDLSYQVGPNMEEVVFYFSQLNT